MKNLPDFTSRLSFVKCKGNAIARSPSMAGLLASVKYLYGTMCGILSPSGKRLLYSNNKALLPTDKIAQAQVSRRSSNFGRI
ncbi:hypothetical protein [Chitinophaga niastensis]|uniref:hypothetical protein n=1 Tax=Chitinophaga niastensis TaxID=536980 RepID=UPI0011B23EB8|nr:hypothetical protein [Chitinophaga niastensis]